jgi:hypothetical protein
LKAPAGSPGEWQGDVLLQARTVTAQAGGRQGNAAAIVQVRSSRIPIGNPEEGLISWMASYGILVSHKAVRLKLVERK